MTSRFDNELDDADAERWEYEEREREETGY